MLSSIQASSATLLVDGGVSREDFSARLKHYYKVIDRVM
jgi:hypothetical protein